MKLYCFGGEMRDDLRWADRPSLSRCRNSRQPLYPVHTLPKQRAHHTDFQRVPSKTLG